MSRNKLMRALHWGVITVLILACKSGFAGDQNDELTFKTARTRKQLSEAELEQLLKGNVYLTLDGLESITEKQAEMLGTANGFSLDSVKELSDRQVESLSHSRFVSLNGLTAVFTFRTVRT